MSDDSEKAKIFAKLHWEDAAAEDYADPKKAFTVYVAEPPDDWKEGMKHEIAPLDAEEAPPAASDAGSAAKRPLDEADAPAPPAAKRARAAADDAEDGELPDAAAAPAAATADAAPAAAPVAAPAAASAATTTASELPPLPGGLASLEGEALASVSYRNLASEDRAQLERILKRCRVVRSDEEAARSGTVHYFQGYAVDHAGAASAREASEMSCPRYEVLVNEGRPLADGDGGGGGAGGGGGNGRGGRRRGGGGFQGRFFDEEATDPIPGVLSPDLRALLGIGPLQPPPYLYKMQALGYPPGYVGPPVAAADARAPLTFLDAAPPPAANGNGGGGAHGAADVLQADFPGLNVPPPPGADLRLWNWRGPITLEGMRRASR